MDILNYSRISPSLLEIIMEKGELKVEERAKYNKQNNALYVVRNWYKINQETKYCVICSL